MIILVNGPPQSGKDTFAGIARRYLINSVEFKMSKPLKDIFRTTFSHINGKMLGLLLEEYKDKKMYKEHEATPRDFQIAMYCCLAEMYGDSVLGWLALERLKKEIATHIIVSDAGRDEEVMKIIEAYDYSQVGIVELSRPGCTFEGDCRGYLSDETKRHVKYKAAINNEHDMDMYEAQVRRLLDKWGVKRATED